MCGLEWFSRIGFDGYVKNYFSSHLFAFMHFLLYLVGESVLAWFSCRVSLLLYSYFSLASVLSGALEKNNREFIEHNATD